MGIGGVVGTVGIAAANAYNGIKDAVDGDEPPTDSKPPKGEPKVYSPNAGPVTSRPEPKPEPKAKPPAAEKPPPTEKPPADTAPTATPEPAPTKTEKQEPKSFFGKVKDSVVDTAKSAVKHVTEAPARVVGTVKDIASGELDAKDIADGTAATQAAVGEKAADERGKVLDEVGAGIATAGKAVGTHVAETGDRARKAFGEVAAGERGIDSALLKSAGGEKAADGYEAAIAPAKKLQAKAAEGAFSGIEATARGVANNQVVKGAVRRLAEADPDNRGVLERLGFKEADDAANRFTAGFIKGFGEYGVDAVQGAYELGKGAVRLTNDENPEHRKTVESLGAFAGYVQERGALGAAGDLAKEAAEPVLEDFREGHYGEALGGVAGFGLEVAVGAKGLSKLGSGARAAGQAADNASGGAKIVDAGMSETQIRALRPIDVRSGNKLDEVADAGAPGRSSGRLEQEPLGAASQGTRTPDAGRLQQPDLETDTPAPGDAPAASAWRPVEHTESGEVALKAKEIGIGPGRAEPGHRVQTPGRRNESITIDGQGRVVTYADNAQRRLDADREALLGKHFANRTSDSPRPRPRPDSDQPARPLNVTARTQAAELRRQAEAYHASRSTVDRAEALRPIVGDDADQWANLLNDWRVTGASKSELDSSFYHWGRHGALRGSSPLGQTGREYLTAADAFRTRAARATGARTAVDGVDELNEAALRRQIDGEYRRRGLAPVSLLDEGAAPGPDGPSVDAQIALAQVQRHLLGLNDRHGIRGLDPQATPFEVRVNDPSSPVNNAAFDFDQRALIFGRRVDDGTSAGSHHSGATTAHEVDHAISANFQGIEALNKPRGPYDSGVEPGQQISQFANVRGVHEARSMLAEYLVHPDGFAGQLRRQTPTPPRSLDDLERSARQLQADWSHPDGEVRYPAITAVNQLPYAAGRSLIVEPLQAIERQVGTDATKQLVDTLLYRPTPGSAADSFEGLHSELRSLAEELWGADSRQAQAVTNALENASTAPRA